MNHTHSIRLLALAATALLTACASEPTAPGQAREEPVQLEYRTGSLRPQVRKATTEEERERARQTVDDIRANPNMGPGPAGQGK